MVTLDIFNRYPNSYNGVSIWKSMGPTPGLNRILSGEVVAMCSNIVRMCPGSY
jgi:hypothetical protein